jgi:RNA polymerase sigma factor (TIGR02999 family)
MAARKITAEEITEQLRNWSAGRDSKADSEVLNLVYDELRRQAHRYLGRERAGQSLQTTGLVHEVYLKLTKQKTVAFESRTHFLAIAARLMRQILIDYARTKYRAKRGGVRDDLPLDMAVTVSVGATDFDLLALDEALTLLAKRDEHLARIVELRFFSGLSVEETAEVLGVSDSTVKRDWQMARAWLRRELSR